MDLNIRKSTIKDLQFLEQLERKCFPKFQQSSRRSLRHSLSSPFQQVWIAETISENRKVATAACILNIHRHTIRMFSIGVLPEFQGNGIGEKLLLHFTDFAIQHRFEKLSLEALRSDEKLIKWYQKAGFVITEILHNYYDDGVDAVRMIKPLLDPKLKNTITNLIIVDDPKRWKLEVEGLRIVSAKSYLSDSEFQSIKNARIFNLSNSYRYQSMGYYVSLLASARDHRAIPNVTTIRDFRNVSIIRTIAHEIDDLLQAALARETKTIVGIDIYFGKTIDKNYWQLGQSLYRLFETPLMHVSFNKSDRWNIQRVNPLSLIKINPDDFNSIQEFALEYFSKKRFQRQRFYHYKYDLAILVNSKEQNPPSNDQALQNFKNAAKKIGFYTEFITKDDYDRLSEFDALFIRETTNVNDYTYHFSRTAYAEGLVVIDDPWSILRCSNKIYLDERMRQSKINTPKTWILNKDALKSISFFDYDFPLVLKQPDSAFSLGVTKVNNAEELMTSLSHLLKKSDLVIAQEFLPSDFDWRIGIIDQKPLFACKYYMAKDHWQIIDWGSQETDNSGEAETVAIEDVPETILKTAVKVASLMGDGLYGVDLKEINGKVFVIEVNDNPNIDAGVEDAVLGEMLYVKIMQSFFNRIEMSRNLARFVSVDSDLKMPN